MLGRSKIREDGPPPPASVSTLAEPEPLQQLPVSHIIIVLGRKVGSSASAVIWDETTELECQEMLKLFQRVGSRPFSHILWGLTLVSSDFTFLFQ